MRTSSLLLASIAATLCACPGPSMTTDGGDDAGLPDAGSDAGVVQRDLDVVVLKLTPTGALDTTFGTGGKMVLDLGQATGSARDTVYGFDVDSAGRVVLFGSTKANGRSDVDRYVARLASNGSLDTSFGVDGYQRLDLGGTTDSARHGFVQPDGKIVATGYSVLPTGVIQDDGGVQTSNFIVIARLDADGHPDSTFGTDGHTAFNPFIPVTPQTLFGLAESYCVVPQSGGKLVSVGYGRSAPSGTVDLLSFRFDNTGHADSTWATAGTFAFDLIGGDERGRHAVVLPDERVMVMGSATPLTGNVDAMLMTLTKDGALDTTFGGTGSRLFSFGRKDEAFFMGALGPGAMTLAAVGYRTGPANTADENDDALLALIPLSTGAPAEFAQPVPLSAGAHDRFTSVAWSGSKVIAAGMVREGDDTRFAVARFGTDGVRDSSFGTDGVATFNLATGGVEEVARAVKVLADGSLLVAGVIEH